MDVRAMLLTSHAGLDCLLFTVAFFLLLVALFCIVKSGSLVSI